MSIVTQPTACARRFILILLLIHTFSLSMEMSRLTRDGTAEPVSRDQILRHARGRGNVHFPCSADHEQDWQPYPVDPYSAICDDHTYIHTHTYIQRIVLATEETTVTHEVSHRPIKCTSRSSSQRGTKANGSHHGDSPLLRPTRIQAATKPMTGLTNREHRKLIK